MTEKIILSIIRFQYNLPTKLRQVIKTDDGQYIISGGGNSDGFNASNLLSAIKTESKGVDGNFELCEQFVQILLITFYFYL